MRVMHPKRRSAPAAECVSQRAVRRKHMEDVASVKVAFQEKTQANAISYLTQYSMHRHSHTPSAPPASLSSLSCFWPLQQAGRLWLTNDPPCWPNFWCFATHTHIPTHTWMSCRAGPAGVCDWQEEWVGGWYLGIRVLHNSLKASVPCGCMRMCLLMPVNVICYRWIFSLALCVRVYHI